MNPMRVEKVATNVDCNPVLLTCSSLHTSFLFFFGGVTNPNPGPMIAKMQDMDIW